MPVFDQTITFDASPELVRAAVKLAVTPAPMAERPERGRALARVGDFLHLFHSSPNAGQTTLQYRVCHDPGGELEQLIDDPALLDEDPAELTDLEFGEVEASATRLETAVAEIKLSWFPPTTTVPFGTLGLFLWTLFLGVGGVFVAAVNWRRMGRRDLFRLTLIFGTAAYLLFALAAIVAAILLFNSETAAYGGEFAFRVVTGIALIRWQRPAYRRWKAEQPTPAGKQQRGDVVFVLTLIGASGLTTFVVALLVGGLVTGTLLSGAEKQFSTSGVHLTYPGVWSQTDDNQTGDFGCRDEFLTNCLVVLRRFNNSGVLAIQRQHSLTPSSNPTFANALTLLGVRLALGNERIRFDKPTALRVGGRPAIRQFGHLSSDEGTIQIILIQESAYDTLTLYAIAAQDRSGGILREIDSIIQSVEFAA